MSAIKRQHNLIVYKGSNFFRQRLVLSILSGKSLRIIDIRDKVGIQDFEVNFIRLLDKITNGTVIRISESGTSLFFQPGILVGGIQEHICANERGMGYYLEPLLMLGPFCKSPLQIKLQGITAHELDPSVDHVKLSMIPVLRKFMLNDEELTLTITKRGMAPFGGGEIILHCPIRRELVPVTLLEYGMVKRIRGTAYTLRMSPMISKRVASGAKGIFLKFLPDVWITTDACVGSKAGESPGFGIHLYAETTTGVIYSAECVSKTGLHVEDPSIPEDVGATAAHRLLEEIYMGGCTDSSSQTIAIAGMAFTPKSISKVVLGPLTEYSINFLQHLREFFEITFLIKPFENEDKEPVPGADKLMLTCLGLGLSNISKPTL